MKSAPKMAFSSDDVLPKCHLCITPLKSWPHFQRSWFIDVVYNKIMKSIITMEWMQIITALYAYSYTWTMWHATWKLAGCKPGNGCMLPTHGSENSWVHCLRVIFQCVAQGKRQGDWLQLTIHVRQTVCDNQCDALLFIPNECEGDKFTQKYSGQYAINL